MVCQEGYFNMLTFMADPHNHSEFEEVQLDLSPKNIRNRSPLFLCFTPPTATVRTPFYIYIYCISYMINLAVSGPHLRC
jgi:hypothetical protein